MFKKKSVSGSIREVISQNLPSLLCMAQREPGTGALQAKELTTQSIALGKRPLWQICATFQVTAFHVGTLKVKNFAFI